MLTYFQDFNRLDDDETEVTVEYTWWPGIPAQTYGPPEKCWPAEPAEVEIVSATVAGGGKVTLTNAEAEKFTQWLIENGNDEE